MQYPKLAWNSHAYVVSNGTAFDSILGIICPADMYAKLAFTNSLEVLEVTPAVELGKILE